EKIKNVMKWAGPRMLFTHPVFACRHVFQMISYKRKLRKEAKAKANV
ncbi:MAG TPA: nitrous oxide-stimulated promoter family protein, partial [Candidatus Borkfalkia faecavium]|nr:nitrous oxide-stimulated promoter family protein [Candidatus Borkfalkia faecavium]